MVFSELAMLAITARKKWRTLLGLVGCVLSSP